MAAIVSAITGAIGFRNMLKIMMAVKKVKALKSKVQDMVIKIALEMVCGLWKGIKMCTHWCWVKVCSNYIFPCCCGLGGPVYYIKECCMWLPNRCWRYCHGYESLAISG